MEKLSKVIAANGKKMAGMSQYYNAEKNEISFLVRQKLPQMLRGGFMMSNSANTGEIKGILHGKPESIMDNSEENKVVYEMFRGLYPAKVKTAKELIDYVKENPQATDSFNWNYHLLIIYTTDPGNGDNEPVSINGVQQFAHPKADFSKKEYGEGYYSVDMGFSPNPDKGFLVYSQIMVTTDMEAPRKLCDDSVRMEAERLSQPARKPMTAEEIARIEAAMQREGVPA